MKIHTGAAGALATLCALCGALAAACSGIADSLTNAGSRAGDGSEPEAPSAGGSAADGGLPQEREVERNYEIPVATKNLVWVANPKSGRVAYIDALSLEVKTALAGNGPTVLAPLPGSDDAAIVLNVLSSDATLLRSVRGELTTQTFRVGVEANTWSISGAGRWAVAWFDHRKVQTPPRTRGYQDLAVIDLTGKSLPVALAVGYRPTTVRFAADEREAYAITEDGISVVGLSAASGPALLRNVAVSDMPLNDSGARDVSITPDGSLALMRREGAAAITAVVLSTGARTQIPLPGVVTDLDLSEDGKLAVCVMRDLSSVALLQIPGILSAPSSFVRVDIPGETIGSVTLSPGSGVGLLYSNAVTAERVTMLSLTAAPTPTYRTARVYAPVLGLFSSLDAAFALVLHDKVAGVAGAFSILPVAATLPAKIVETKAPPTAVAFSDASDRFIVAERGTQAGSYGAYLGRLPQLRVDRFALASPPSAVGIVPSAKRAYIAQDYPDGRITFIDLETGLARTLTGFELGARVVDGSKP
jgi:hypothetical protein